LDAQVSRLERKGRDRGVRLAKEIVASALLHYPGVYLITPFLHYETTIELSKFAGGL
jgi:methionine synthase / methylenetetrahydrofolate reductase(NADPH)